MCGIFAALGPPRATRLDAALDALRHRGPDGAGRWIDARAEITLAHTRLALIGRNAPQPLHAEDGQIHAVINGELYGFQAIRAALEGRGHRFATDGDGEILVHLYEELGEACLERLRGEFAFALWDGRRGRFFAARDRFGIKPLKWSRRPDGGLWLSSNAAALFAYGHPRRLDLQTLAHVATHQYPPTHKSPFEGIEALPPGHALIAERGEVRIWRYWDPLEIAPEGVSDGEALEALGEALEEAVSLRTYADAPLAYALSGGLDSSLVAALGAAHAAAPVHTFGVSFPEAPGYDERGAAEAVARHIGAEHHAVEVRGRDLIADLDAAVIASEGWAINGQLVGKHKLNAAVAAAGFKGILTGEGADEACFGYAHLLADMGRDEVALGRRHAAQAGIMLGGAGAPGLEVIAARLGYVPSFLKAKVGIGARLRPLLRDELLAEHPAEVTLGRLLEGFDDRGRAAARQSAALWADLCLGGYILPTLGDGAEMAHSVEGRPPFLDHRFFEAAWRIPAARHLGRIEKRLLRELAAPHLPASTVARPKRPFLAPPLWSEETRGAIRARLLEGASREAGICDQVRLEAWLGRLDAAPEARQGADPVLMLLLTTEALLRGLRLGV